MTDISVSLWLPVGRANFYSVTANGWMKGSPTDGNGLRYWSEKLDDPKYIPILQCSVLRRLLEVLPRSFGYDAEGVCESADESDERSRPINVTMTLVDVEASLHVDDGPRRDERLSRRAGANLALHRAGVRRVRMLADEHGNYTFTATLPDESVESDSAAARQALIEHACAVFGGGFEVKRFVAQPRRGSREGAAAVRRYNGLTDTPSATVPDDTAPEEDVVGPPLGALTFFQLNTLVEGICNETLWPAVFFERYEFMRQWQDRTHTAVSMLHTIGDIIDIIHVDESASDLKGQITALRHFLAVTSRESLQRIKWSVESVRRSLLDEMMSVLHRQSRLTQLDLGAIKREQSPELAVDASESQLRGYVILAAAKMPLIANVYEVANLTVDHIRSRAKRERRAQLQSQDAALSESLDEDVHELRVQLSQWKVLLDGLGANVASMEKAVEQAWMERLLYEEQQSRSEQEAMAEIERSRFGRPTAGNIGKTAYDAFNLVFAAMAVLFVVVTTDFHDKGSGIDWGQVVRLWPIGVAAVVFYLVIPVVGFLYRWHKDSRGTGTNYSYEFAFLIDESTTPELVNAFIKNRKRQRIKQTAAELSAALDAALGTTSGPDGAKAAPQRKRLKGLSLTRLGAGRIERISADSSSLKLHSVVAFRVARFKYARFEIVNEVLANRVSDQPRYYLHQIRMFGDSPKSINPEAIVELVDVIYNVVARPLATDKKVEDPLSLLRVLYA